MEKPGWLLRVEMVTAVLVLGGLVIGGATQVGRWLLTPSDDESEAPPTAAPVTPSTTPTPTTTSPPSTLRGIAICEAFRAPPRLLNASEEDKRRFWRDCERLSPSYSGVKGHCTILVENIGDKTVKSVLLKVPRTVAATFATPKHEFVDLGGETSKWSGDLKEFDEISLGDLALDESVAVNVWVHELSMANGDTAERSLPRLNRATRRPFQRRFRSAHPTGRMWVSRSEHGCGDGRR
jgi:hypothetical protein